QFLFQCHRPAILGEPALTQNSRHPRGGVISGWKSKLLASISLFLVSKSDFLAADQLGLRSPAAPVTGSFLYMPPRATAFTVLLLPQAIQCRDGPTGLAVQACSFFGSLTGLRRLFRPKLKKAEPFV